MTAPFYSHAFNFSSSTQRGVDPRTGLFNPATPICKLVGNANLGPSLDVTLNYNPLLDGNNGFGSGFSLQYSTYDLDQKRLTVSTGEVYIVDEDSSGVWLRQQGLETFRFERLRDAYKITHQSGDIELLAGPDTADRIKVPFALYAPSGHSLNLEWTYSPEPRLIRIGDETADLLRIAYDDRYSAVFHIWPDTKEAYDVSLYLSNGHLTSIETPCNGDTLNWTFGYDQIDSYYLVSNITAPTGLVETVTYGARLNFPDNAHQPPLPAVTRYVQDPGQDQAAIVSTYQYTPENYLGYGSDAAWHPDADYLYGVLTDYVYQSVETTRSDDDVITVTRSYDNFHLQIEETTRQRACEKSTRTTYYAFVNAPFDEQPPQFQLPMQVDVVYSDDTRADGAQSRSESTLTEFDTSGNPTRVIAPDGTQIDCDYYPAEGSAGDCPPDPNGFVRFMRTKTITPPATSFDAPVRSERYRYTAMPAVQQSGSPVASFVALTQESLTSDGIPLIDKTTDYINTPTSSGHARISRISTQIHHLDASSGTYASTLDFTFAVDTANGTLTQTTRVSGHDGLTACVTRCQSSYSGRVASETDAQGNVSAFTYDSLGRRLTETRDPGTEFEQTIRTAYARTEDSATGKVSRVSTTRTDVHGNTLQTNVDGLGRAIRQLANDIDNPVARHPAAAPVYEIGSKQYDGLGRLASGVSQDYLRDAGGQVTGASLTDMATIGYDDWGQRNATAWNDGLSVLNSHDPVGMTSVAQTQGSSFSASGATLRSGRRVTEYNVQHLPTAITDYDVDGVAQGAIVQQYDGAGRLRRRTDELGQTTHFAYDAFGRVTTTTLPDGTFVDKSYAPFSVDTLVTGVSVTDAQNRVVVLGSQDFDSLKRRVMTQSGGRTYLFRYDGAARRPATVTTPDGEIIACSYVSQLDESLAQLTAGSTAQSFSYDPATGAMLNATENDTSERRWVYAPSGTLSSESVVSGNGTDQAARFDGSLRGRLQQSVDVTGDAQTYRYDSLGRNTDIVHPAGRVQTAYDAMGRMTGYTTTDAVTGTSLRVALTLDDFDREIARDFFQGDARVLQITQAWNANWQLAWRTTRQGDRPLRDEQFSYDVRNRLSLYACNGDTPNIDTYGNAVAWQSFHYDALNNLLETVTTFVDPAMGSDTATFHYDNTDDPTQLTSITHTHAGYPATLAFQYDANGRMTCDSAGRSLRYDALGRLRSASSGGETLASYDYDALNTLIKQTIGSDDRIELYYRAGLLANEVRPASREYASTMRIGDDCVGVASGPVTSKQVPFSQPVFTLKTIRMP
ncbi:RHS repeat domain-containing protein [Paraburkholderia sp.]|uniref:RHS repeat domain-containing protein n=1 Tax=Paraburkholderia sp. TaxID=1926495 RepID=UPI002385ED5B|nr:RHS repeat domain-containing protein [Paraburkholderia sp.]MDE1184484.1 hypothetical protein [Paraburkholderia sp.]